MIFNELTDRQVTAFHSLCYVLRMLRVVGVIETEITPAKVKHTHLYNVKVVNYHPNVFHSPFDDINRLFSPLKEDE